MSKLPPGPPVDAAALIEQDPCSALPEMRIAYYRLIAGTQRSHVGYHNRTTTYHSGNAVALAREIRRLESMCPGPGNPTPHARAVVGRGAFPGRPVSPAGMLPAGWLGGPSRYRG